ncbi:MAG: PKD domain-containing protein [Thermoplasmata archaeon]|nr:MAG: PKD domain-containing protein [Thermoplasmata archaeon]
MRTISAIITALMLVLVSILIPPQGQSIEEISIIENTYRRLDFFVKDIEGGEGEGFEPHIIAGPGIDGNEWYYIDSPTGLGGGQSGNFWISKDGGESWEAHPYGRNAGGSGDSYTVIAKDGTIYYTDLYLWSSTIDTSKDGGETWIRNPLATVTRVGDRQWLRMGPTINPLPGMQAETVYLIYNDIPQGLVIQRSSWTSQGLVWVMGNNRMPVSTSAGSRDYFAVDPHDGTIYLPNKESGNDIICYVSTDGANSFSRHPVMSADEDIQNIFIAADVDEAGNVYFAWSSQWHIYLGVSTDQGANWKVTQVTDTNGTRVLPWVVAGDPGRAALTWYDTPDEEGTSDEKADHVNWSVQAAITTDALSDNISFIITPILDYVHSGSISTGGLGGEADRDLGDFFTNDVDEKGRLIITFGMDGADGLNQRGSAVMFAKQLEGPFLLENVGPVALFDNTTRGLTVEVDGSRSYDQGGGGIVEYLWDWGDGSNGTGMEASHTYNESGKYEIRLKVINKEDMRDSTSEVISVKGEKLGYDYTWLLLIVAVIIALVIIVFVYTKSSRKKVVEVETVAESPVLEEVMEVNVQEPEMDEGDLG